MIPQHLANQVDERQRIAEPDQPGGDLDVEDPPRDLPGLEQADPQVLAGGVHDDLDRRVVTTLPERARSRTARGSIDRQPLARRHLDQASVASYQVSEAPR